jgi:integrase
LTVERAKSGRPRRIPLDAETVEILKGWRRETDGVFVQPWRPRHAQRAAINSSDSKVNWHWHQLRHTFATQYLRDGGSIEALSKLLGHSEVRTTEIYGAIEERLIRADFARVQGRKLAMKLATAAP